MARRALAIVLVAACLAATSCDSTPNLTQALAVTDVLSGWYDNGFKDGKNHLLPSITFRLKNQSDRSIYGVQLSIAFWQDGADGEWDSRLVTGIGGTPIAAGQSTEPITVHAGVGYTAEVPRAEIFTNSAYKDVTVKMFAKRGGRIYAVGQFKVEHRIIPHMKDSGRS